MSTDPDKDTACPKADKVVPGTGLDEGDTCLEVSEKKRKKPSRSVRFPDEDQLVTQYFEPANPWQDVPNTTRAQLAADYLEGCRRHNTTPIDTVLQQIRELPENSIGGGNRAGRLTLSECSLSGAAPVDALEALLRKVQFRRLEIQYCEVDDEGAEAMFDMIEYYESATVVSITGPRQFGIRGWQAACRMIKKSAELSELSLCESALCASHAPVLVRALRPHTCRLRALCLQRAELRGEPLLCLVIALKSNTSIRELRLPDNQLSISDAQQLASLLKLNLHIQLLDLSNNDIQDAGTGHIADALVEQAAQTPPSAATSPLSPLHCPPGARDTRLGLAFLVLWNNQLTRNCAPHLSKALRSSQSLCVLNIGRNALGADTVRALQCGSSLVSLGLQCARLGPGAARPLADLLRADTKLQRLDLRDNRLGVAGLQAILNAMQENTTLTQIDLDDPVECTTLSAEDGEAATVARLTRDITALCRRNEPPATEPERRVHRKISLTCHTAFSVKPGGRCPEGARSRTVRLRSPAPSPAPSPAGSPVPHNSRFNVTRVTPDRESSTESTSPVPSRAPHCLTPSRFKVVQVAEPPQIQIHAAAASKKRTSSRFSVTRNYDAMYNPSPPSVSPTPSVESPGVSPSPSVSPVPRSPTPLVSSPTEVMVPTTMMTDSPRVITGSPTVMTGSTPVLSSTPKVVVDLSTVMTDSPRVITGSPTVLTGSTPVLSSTPKVVVDLSTVMTDSPRVITGSPSVMTGSPTVMTGSPSVMTGSTTVLSSSPKVVVDLSTVMTDSPRVISSSPIVMTDSTTVMTGSPTVMTGSITVLSSSPTVVIGPTTVMTETPRLTTDSPFVVTDSINVMTGSPTVMTDSPTVMTSSPTVVSSSPMVEMVRSPTVTGSPTMMSSLPAVMTGSPTVTSSTPTVMTAAPTVMTGSPTVMSSSPTVTTAIPSVMTDPPTVMSSSPTVITAAPTVMTGSPTVMSGSRTVTTTLHTVMTGSSLVMSGSPKAITATPTMMTSLPVVMSCSPTLMTASPTEMTDSPMVKSGSPTDTGSSTVMTCSHKVISGPTTTELSTAVSSVLPINTFSLANKDSATVISESPSLRIMKGSQTVGVLTTASATEILANLSPTRQTLDNYTPTMTTPISCAATRPKLATSSLILTSVPTTISISVETSISASSFVTSVVKASMSPLLTAVPSVSHMSQFENIAHEPAVDQIVKTVAEQVRVKQEVHASKISDIHNVSGSIEKNVEKTESPIFKTATIAEDVCINSTESSNATSTFVSGASIDTLTGTIVSGTSLDTLSGTISGTLIDEAYKDIEIIESLTKVTDFERSWSNIDPILSSRNTDDSWLEPTSGATAIPKNVLELDDFSISHEHCDTFKEITKPIVIGCHSNILATENKAPVNIEADILTMLAEITEKVEPKVVEPKALPDSIDLDKHKIEGIPILETITSEKKEMSQEKTLITIFTEVSGNAGLKIEKDVDLDKPTDISQQITPKQNILKPIDISEQFTEADEGSFIDLRSISTKYRKHTMAEPFKESIQSKELDKVDLKSILIGEVRHTETKAELPETKEPVDVVAKFDYSSKLDDVTPHISISDSDKVSETKTSESVKNKTYSDAVKTDPKYLDKSEQLTHREEISDSVVKTETKLVKNSVEVCESDKLDVQIEVTIKKVSVHDAKVHSDQNKDFVNVDNIIIKKEPRTMKQIEALTEDLGNLIQEMKDMSSKSRKVKSDCTVDIVSIETNTVPGNFNRDVVLKKNKSESSLDSPDLEVSRLMNKKLVGSPFCDSSSSLEVSGSSMESLNATEHQNATCHVIPKQVVIQESVESDTELDRRKDLAISMGSSIESASDVPPVNSGNYLNMSVSSNESVSPIIFGKKKKINDSLSSLEASVSSLDSGRQEKVMVTSADSGIEYSLQQPSENKEDNSSNEGTLTHNSSLRETVKKTEHETLTSSPKRTSSLLDVPALKTKGLDRMRKISWVAPSSSFHIPKVETEKLEKPSHLEKLLSLFQHPTSLFSRSQSDEEKKTASNTPPRKDSSLTSSFWSWGSTIEKDDKEDSSEATDSTLSERVQVSFVDESFSKKLDSKTPSTDTDNTLSEFQSFPIQTNAEKVTDTTDEDLVQKCLGLSLTDKASSNGNSQRASDTTDLNKPNDFNRNYDVSNINEEESENKVVIEKDDKDETKIEAIRPRSFAAVLKSSGSENSLDKQPSPESGQPVDKLPSKVIRGIKENISPENTLTSSMTNTKTLALELTERQVKNQPIVNTVWEVPIFDKIELRTDEVRTHSDLAPIATIDETCDEAADNTVNVKLEFIDDVKTDNPDLIDTDSLKKKEVIIGRYVERRSDLRKEEVTLERGNVIEISKRLENVDLGKDALSYLIYESQNFETDTEHAVSTQIEGSLAQELKEAEIKEMLDLSPELIIDEALEPEVFTKEVKGVKPSPVIPDRAKLKKSNSLEDLSQREENEKSSPKTKTIAFKVPETQPRDIPRSKLRTMSGSSPKSLPESLNKPCPLTRLDSTLKKRKKVSSLGKMAKDSLLALNMSEEEIAEYRRSYVTSAESLRSLESVSEDANSQSGTSVDSRCRSCLRTSQESLMSLDSITEDCKCGSDCEKSRSVR